MEVFESKGMKTRWVILIITACIALMLYLRIALPFNNIFTGQWIKFSSIDAYWQMANIDRIAPDFPAYITQIFNVPFFQWLLSGIIWCIGLGNPTQTTIDTVAVYFPPILAALTVIPVYFIGKLLFNRFVGLASVAILAVLPGEWLGRSTLGFTDHHIMEILFSTTALMFFLFALKTSGKKRITYSLLFALLIFICVYSWTSGILIVAIAIFYLIIQIVLGEWKNTYYSASFIVLLFLAGAFLGDNLSLIPRMWAYLTTSTTITTTMEMMPLLFPTGTFTLIAAWVYFTTLIFVIPVAMAILLAKAIKHRDSNAVFLLIWSVVMLTAMLFFRRFAYYFAVNAALLGGFMAWYIWDRIKEKNLAFFVTALFLCTVMIPNYQVANGTARQIPYMPSNAWMEALEWTKDNTAEDDLILAWWDYGYWIMREADRTAYANPMQDKVPVTNTARMFLSSDNTHIAANYIIIDRDTVLGKTWAIAKWAGKEPTNYNDIYYVVDDTGQKPVHLFHPEYYQSLMVRLYFFDGQAVTPKQSAVIQHNGKVLNNIDVYGSYQEAVENLGRGKRLVGTSAFISPVPLEKVEGYSLIYKSVEEIDGISIIKIFKRG